jgi:transposase
MLSAYRHEDERRRRERGPCRYVAIGAFSISGTIIRRQVLKFEGRIKELVENLPDLAILIEPLLIVRRALREQVVILHRRLLAIVRDDAVCRRLMTTPGVGPVVALTYRATVDVPARFRKSKSVGAVFGLTCAKYQSGEIDRSGRISRCGSPASRS